MSKAEAVNGSMASCKSPGGKEDLVQQLKMPKLEPPGINNSSPKCVLRQNLINLASSSSSSSEDEAENESGSNLGTGSSSDHSDRSDSDEEEYKVCSDQEDDEEEGRPPLSKKPKITSKTTTEKGQDELPAGAPIKKKSRVKTTAKRADSFPPKMRNSNPGRRKVGGRIYDSVLGRTCHWCRQKTVELHVECALCPIRFCGACLLNRHGEHIDLEMLVRWICPKCRGGCGPGCRNCCNCGPCRKSQGIGPTGQLVSMARTKGFTNVHDYLVDMKTNEGPQAIALRKKGRKWTKDSGALFHSSLLKKHAVEEVNEEEEEGDVKKEVVEEAELYCERAKVKDEPVYVHDEPRKENISSECRKEKISYEPRTEKISDESRMETISDDHEMDSPDWITRSACGTSVSQSEPTNSPVQIFVSENPCENIWPEKSSSDAVSHHGTSRVTSSWSQESNFARELENTLQRPFSMHQMKEMWEHVNFRKPVMKLRQTRSRAIEVPGSVDGLAYLDHYPELATKLKKSTSPEEKLRLLRGFFFWLQRSCMEGAYRPWRDAPTVDDSGDCTEISGPDCEIIRVLLAIDEDEDNAPPEWEDTKPTIRPAEVKKFLSPKQALSSFPVNVKQEKEG